MTSVYLYGLLRRPDLDAALAGQPVDGRRQLRVAQQRGHVDIEQLAIYPILACVFVLGWRARNTERHEVRV